MTRRTLSSIATYSALIASAGCLRVLHVGIPAPTGTHGVGRATFVMVDSSRADPWTSTGERRAVLVKAWYPAVSTTEPSSPYLENASKLPGEFQRGERWIVQRLSTHAHVNARTPGAKLPTLFFSPGADTPPEYYSGLLEELASRGYVVLAMDHSYEGRGQVLPDGRVLGIDSERYRPPLPTDSATAARNLEFYRKRVEVRAADASFVVDAFQRGAAVPVVLRDAVDPSRLGAFGHSLGGVAAAEICRRDRRFSACAVIDGLVRGLPVLPGSPSMHPHSLLYMGKPIPGTPRISADSGWALVRRVVAESGGGYDVLVPGVTHQDFSDSPFMTPTVHPVKQRARLTAIREVVVAFFDETLLLRRAALLDDAALRTPAGVRVTRVAPIIAGR